MRGALTASVALLLSLVAGCLDADEPPAQTEDVQDVLEVLSLPAKMAWRALPEGPTPRAEVCTANVGPLFYTIGGYASPSETSLPGPAGAIPYDEATATASVDVYDAEKDTWTTVASVPVTKVDHCDAIGYDGSIYLFHSSGNWKITPPANEWTALAAWPNGHNYGGYGEIGGKFYFAAGGSPKVDVYDPATDKWTTLDSEIPTSRGHTSGAALNGKLWVVGGDTGGHSVNTGANEAFDPATGLWEKHADLPVLRGSLATVAYRGHLVTMGGQNGGGGVDSFNDVNVYDPVTDSWSELPKMIQPKHGFTGGVWNDAIYVFAGSPQQGVDATARASVLEPAV